MSWNRTDAVKAIVQALSANINAAWIFDKTPQTINPPAVVVSRPDTINYSFFALGIDEATIPVVCVGAADGEDTVDALITAVRQSFPDPSLGGIVSSCVPSSERGWRNASIAGIDVLQAEVVLTVQM